MKHTIEVLDGDQTGQELLEQALRIREPEVVGLYLEFVRFDLSLQNRRSTENKMVYDQAHEKQDRCLVDAIVAVPGFTIESNRLVQIVFREPMIF